MRAPRRQRAPHARAGTTLVEVILAAALFASFAGAVFLAVEGSARSYGTEATAARLAVRARETMDQITARLREVDRETVTPSTLAPQASTSSLEFQRATGFSGGGAEWGPTERLTFELAPGELEDGLDNDGDGRVDEGRVVWIEDPLLGVRRTVLCSDVSATFEGEVPGNGLDDNGNGLVDERGFCIEFTGTRLVVRLTLEDQDRDGNRIVRSTWRTITPRNTPEE